MSTRINLLPWRETERKEQDRQLLSIGIFAWMLMGLIIFYAHMHISGMIEGQTERNNYLNGEIAKLDKIIKKIGNIKKRRKALVARMNVIYKLQADRTRVVHILDDLAQILPEGVYYTSMEQKGRNLVLLGSAQSNARVSTLMRNLENSTWFSGPNLQIVRANRKGSRRVSKFKMTVVQRNKPKPQTKEVKKDATKDVTKAGSKT